MLGFVFDGTSGLPLRGLGKAQRGAAELALLLQSVSFLDKRLGEAFVFSAQLSVFYLKCTIKGIQTLVLFTFIVQTVKSILFSHVVTVHPPNLFKERVFAFWVCAGSALSDGNQSCTNFFIRAFHVGALSFKLFLRPYKLSFIYKRPIILLLVLILLVNELLFSCISHALLLDLVPFFLFALFFLGFIRLVTLRVFVFHPLAEASHTLSGIFASILCSFDHNQIYYYSILLINRT